MSAAARLSAVAAVAVVFLGASCAPDDAPPSASATRIDAPASATAGSPIEVVVTTDRPGPLTLDVVDAFAVTSVDGVSEHGTARFIVDGALTELSGTLTFRAVDPDGNGISASTTISPHADLAPIDLTVGPRTVVADAADQTMAVAVVADVYGNPLADRTPVSFSIDDGSVAADTSTIEHGVASLLIGSDTTAGRVEVFARSPGVAGAGSIPTQSPRIPYHEVAGAPLGTELILHSPARTALRADGRMLVDVRTGPIVDRHGNLLPDGHAVRIGMQSAEGAGHLTATTIDGIARFTLRAPDRPGPVELRLLGDDDADPLVLEFARAVSELPLRLTSRGDRTVLDIGPVLDERGAIVADGTTAHVTGIDGTAGVVTIELRNGVARLTGIATTEAIVTVLGTTVEATS